MILNVLYPSKAKLSTPSEIPPLPLATLSGSSELPEMLSALLSHSSCAEREMKKDDSLAYSVRMTILLLLLEHQLSKEDPEEKDPYWDE